MNKNATPIILLILAIGIYFTFTKGKIEEFRAIEKVNAGYQQAINNSEKLIKKRDQIVKTYNEISDNDKIRLEKMVPDNIDNVRLTLDVKSIGLGRGLVLKNIKTDAPNINTSIASMKPKGSPEPSNINVSGDYNTVILTFNVTTTFQNFVDLLKDLETSLRIIDVSKITLNANDNGLYDYNVELRTYWLK